MTRSSGPETLSDWLQHWAGRRPEAAAFITSDAQVSFRDYDEAANRLASALVRLGLSSGDRVGVLLPDGQNPQTAFQECFYRFMEDHSLLSMESIRGGTLLELTYAVKLKKGTDQTALLAALREINGNHKVALLTGTTNAEL